ncbi:Hypothetical predicted protein [Pelobates cultripes]|uniref:Uncharacterized protein n=1 Tax=Pelobates cultripes TaxID=61616 RepID=A0AAD1QYY0_PELCU|nr:Hypothetical predicted protein [Pelobates cultripes]
MGKKIRCKFRAYPAYEALEAAIRNAVITVTTPPTESGTIDPANMGRRSQQAATGGGTNTQDISTMLQRPAAPKMAAMPEQDTSSAGLEQPLGEITDPQPHMDIQPDPDALTPATKLDIRNLLAELKHMSVQTTEEDILDVQHEVRGLKETVIQLQTSHSALLNKLDAAEDRNRRNNVKIRGIPDDVSHSEPPHYLRRLFAILPPHSQAKTLTFAGIFRTSKQKQVPPLTNSDVIMRYQTLADRNNIFAATRGKTLLDFIVLDSFI